MTCPRSGIMNQLRRLAHSIHSVLLLLPTALYFSEHVTEPSEVGKYTALHNPDELNQLVRTN